MSNPTFGSEEDFQQFLTDLGPGAERYTEEELRRLYSDVHWMALFLIEVHQQEQRLKVAKSELPEKEQLSLDLKP